MKKRFKSIIIFNPFGIGDVLFSTPLIESVKKAFPESGLTYICNRRTSYVLSNNPYISRILIFEKDEFRNELKASKPKFIKKVASFLKEVKDIKADLLIDLSMSMYSSLITGMLGIRERIGFDYHRRGRFMTKKIAVNGFENEHVVYHDLKLLSLIGVDFSVSYPVAFTEKETDKWAEKIFHENKLQGRMTAGIIPGGGMSWGIDAAYRRWPAERFARVVDGIMKEFQIVPILFGESSEEPLCREVESLIADKENVINMGGKTDVSQFMSLVKKCDFVFCNEGGPLHIASSLGVPTVSIFGPVDERIYGPLSKDMDKHIIVTNNSVECRPCYSKFRHVRCDRRLCLENITEDMVYGKMKAVISGLSKRKKESVHA